jgi:hypothetical protein
MRTHIPKLMMFGVAGGIAAYMFSRRRPPAPESASDEQLLAPDPEDPVQSMDALDQVDLDDLDVDALSMAEGTGEIERATVESSLEERAMELDTPEDTTLDAIEQSASDVGDLYGVHTPRAADRVHPDDDQAMEDGQNWIEALETSAAENGPMPEESLESIVDDEDIYAAPHPSDSEDTPVADRGSGGPAGI